METAEVILPPCQIKPLPVIAPHCSTSPRSCPWAKTIASVNVSFNDVMSEQLATSLQEEDEKLLSEPDSKQFIDDLPVFEDDTDCSDDHVLAKMLQLEFDKEHDNILKNEVSKYNGKSKVTVSFGKYFLLPEASYSSDEEDDDYLEQNAKAHWRNFEKAEKDFQAVGKSGIFRHRDTTTTKHDLTVCGRRNAGKIMEFPPCIETGDGGTFDMRISNNVYNSLRSYSKAEDRRQNRVHDKREKSTIEKALDEKTHLILYKLINNQTLESLSGCVSTGKESCVYHAWSGLPETESPSPEFAIKVYKTSLNEFQNRDQYIRDDHRFRHRFGNQNPRKTIHMWAEKEMRNLLSIKEANLPCPEVVVLKKHVLVMSFIGKKMLPAPKLKDVDLPYADMEIIYEQVLAIMKTLYSKCRLVHADLSEYNLLWHEDKVWVIDVSQSVEITHPHAFEFLLRDCTNMSNFFEKRGVLKVLKPVEMFTDVCGQVPKKSISVQ